MGSGNRSKLASRVLLAESTPDAARASFRRLAEEQKALNSKIFACAWHCEPDGMKAALEAGADVFCTTGGGYPKTALQVCAKYGNRECCEMLVKGGLDPLEKNKMTSDGSGR